MTAKVVNKHILGTSAQDVVHTYLVPVFLRFIHDDPLIYLAAALYTYSIFSEVDVFAFYYEHDLVIVKKSNGIFRSGGSERSMS